MTDDLVKRLRIAADRADTVFDPDFASPWREAADRIEQLEAAYAQQQQVWSDAIARADRYEEALRNYVCDCMPGECPDGASKQCGHTARAALGEKKDG